MGVYVWSAIWESLIQKDGPTKSIVSRNPSYCALAALFF